MHLIQNTCLIPRCVSKACAYDSLCSSLIDYVYVNGIRVCACILSFQYVQESNW